MPWWALPFMAAMALLGWVVEAGAWLALEARGVVPPAVLQWATEPDYPQVRMQATADRLVAAVTVYDAPNLDPEFITHMLAPMAAVLRAHVPDHAAVLRVAVYGQGLPRPWLPAYQTDGRGPASLVGAAFIGEGRFVVDLGAVRCMNPREASAMPLKLAMVAGHEAMHWVQELRGAPRGRSEHASVDAHAADPREREAFQAGIDVAVAMALMPITHAYRFTEELTVAPMQPERYIGATAVPIAMTIEHRATRWPRVAAWFGVPGGQQLPAACTATPG